METQTKAPEFSLPDQDGKMHSLSDYAGKIVLLYFYPKDMTSGCTAEAQGFRDKADEYKKRGIVVLGVSVDSVDSHKKFCDLLSPLEPLNFTLLSDEKKEVVGKYGVWKEGDAVASRESFLIDENGFIKKHYEKVDPITHTEEVLRDVDEYKNL